MEKDLKKWQSVVVELRQKTFQDAINWRSGLNSEFFLLRNNLDSYDPHIPESYQTRYKDLESSWTEIRAEYQRLTTEKLSTFNKLYEQLKLPAIKADGKIKP